MTPSELKKAVFSRRRTITPHDHASHTAHAPARDAGAKRPVNGVPAAHPPLVRGSTPRPERRFAVGRFVLDASALEIDLSANLLARNKSSPWYLDAVDLASNYHKLKSLQCPDNLVRTRLIRAWEGVEDPKLRMRLVLHPRGRYLYEVAPHSLFMGGIQLDVQAFLEDESETHTETEASPVPDEADPHRKHA